MSGGEVLHVQKKTRSVFRVWKLRRKFVLCFTEFPILFAFKRDTLRLLPWGQKKFPLVFVLLVFSFIRTAAVMQRKLFQDTRALKSCICSKCCAWDPTRTKHYASQPLHSSLKIRKCFSQWYLQVLGPFPRGKPALCCLSLREKSKRLQSCSFGCEVRGCGSALHLQRRWLLRRGVMCKHQFGGE